MLPTHKPLPQLDAKPKKKVEAKEVAVVNTYQETLKKAVGAAVGLSAFIGLGVLNPDPAFLAMVTTFSLAVIAGY